MRSRRRCKDNGNPQGQPQSRAKPPECGRGRCEQTCADATAERPVNTQRGPRGGAPTGSPVTRPTPVPARCARPSRDAPTTPSAAAPSRSTCSSSVRSWPHRALEYKACQTSGGIDVAIVASSTRPRRPPHLGTGCAQPSPTRSCASGRFPTSPAMPKPAGPPPVHPAVITAVSRRGTAARIPGGKQRSDS